MKSENLEGKREVEGEVDESETSGVETVVHRSLLTFKEKFIKMD